MKRFKLVYSQKAYEDLYKIREYISNMLQGSEIAKKQINRILQAIKSLELFPNRYKILSIEPWHSKGVHQVSIDNFVVLYIVNNDEVRIIRVFGAKQDGR